MQVNRITVRGTQDQVWFAFDGGEGAEIGPELARELARKLKLHAEQADILKYDMNAKVGSRESVIEA